MKSRRVAKAGSVVAALLLLPCTVHSQAVQTAPEAASDPDIVVTGRPEDEPSRSAISRQARAITRPQNMYHHPLARFEDPLCPGILGMKVEFAEMMVDRIRYNAEALNLWMAGEEGCTPNFVVAFVKDGQSELSSLESRHGYLFSDLSAAERTELVAQSGPARVWTTTAMRTRDGMPIGESQGLTDPPVANMWMAHSKIYLAVREDITQVVVLFDAKAVTGKSLIQLADYATMRGLARTRPVEDDPTMDTILTLFHSDTPPEALTQFDRAYLAALYDSIPNMPGITKLLGVNRQLRVQEAATQRNPEPGVEGSVPQ